MLTKIKINICLLAAAALAWAAPALAAPPVFFQGGERLKAAVWQLGAFVPAAAGQEYGARGITVDGVAGLPPTTINLTFDEPLDPWPVEIKLSFTAESGDPPKIFTITDRRPFGGPNLKMEGASARQYGKEEPAALFVDILERLGRRLLANWPPLGPVEWTEAEPGLSTARARLLYGARLGSGDLFLVRAEPEFFAFKPYHENNFPLAGPAALNDWAARLGRASALINAGQYYPDRSYMGVLKRDGADLSAGEHEVWKGFLVSGPTAEAPRQAPQAAIIDLETAPEGLRPKHYQNVMQSYMLLDRLGRVRVRNSRNLAGRAAIGRDSQGRIILMMTPSAITLYDLAMALKNSGLVTEALGLDGGFEARIMLRKDSEPLTAGGQFSITDNRALYLPGYSPTLPAVLAVERLEPRFRPSADEEALEP